MVVIRKNAGGESSDVTTLPCWTDISMPWRRILIKASGVKRSVLGTANFLPAGMSFFTASRLLVVSKLSASCMKEWTWKLIFNYFGACVVLTAITSNG